MKFPLKEFRRLRRSKHLRFGKILLIPLIVVVLAAIVVLHVAHATDTKTAAYLADVTNSDVQHNTYPKPTDQTPIGANFDLCGTFQAAGLDVTDPPDQYYSGHQTVTGADFSHHRKGKQCFHITYDARHNEILVQPALTDTEQHVYNQKVQAQQDAEDRKTKAELLRQLAEAPKIQTRDLDGNLLISTATNIIQTQTQILGITYQDQDVVKQCSEDDGVIGYSNAPNGKAYSCKVELRKDYVPVSGSHDSNLNLVNQLTTASKKLGFTEGHSLGDKGYIDDEGDAQSYLIDFEALGTINGFQCNYINEYTSVPRETGPPNINLAYLMRCGTTIDTSVVPPGFSK